MSFRTFQEGLRIATDTASKAIASESSLSSLSPLVSPLPTLQKTFSLYIASAESYSHLLSSDLVPSHERETIKKRWRLVLERAEKVKKRIEDLGGHVGKVDPGDEGLESAVVRRGGLMNGLKLDQWTGPPTRGFDGEVYREKEPDMPDVDVVWRDVDEAEWESPVNKDEAWIVRQGTGADCSVAAGLGVSLEHDRLWGSRLGSSSLYPQGPYGPRRSQNGKHVMKLLLNGAWRGIIIDSLLPYSSTTHKPLHATTHPLSSSDSTSIGPPWIPLATKAYFKALGGYTVRGSDPGPDIYAFTGWIPERLSLKEGFQREKEWKRIYRAWIKGDVLVTLGTGKEVQRELVPFHAYAVIGLKEDKGERVLEIVDPGSTPRQADGVLEQSMNQLSLQPIEGLFSMTWDQVCGDFAAISLNWNPELSPNTAIRHWSWPKRPEAEEAQDSLQDASPRYRLSLREPVPEEVSIMLSQHTVNKDRPLDDIALHVFEEHQAGGSGSMTRVLHPQRAESASPYSNGLHVLVRFTPRRPDSDLVIIASRDRGIFQRDFTLQAFAPSTTRLTLDRIKASLPFSYNINGNLNTRNAGGHPGNPSHMINPQYKVIVRPDSRKKIGVIKMMVQGDREIPWNIKLVWGNGTRVTDLSEDAVIADSGAYSFGMAYCDVPDIQAGTYTAIVSTFEPGTTAPFSLSFESDRALGIDAIPAEGAGLYSRAVNGRWTVAAGNAGGRPSSGSYHSNPKVEIILPRSGVVISRLHLPDALGHPINLTVFKRNTDGALGDQVATTGPYSDTLSGVSLTKTKLEAGIYLFIPSTYDKGAEGAWTLNVWSDVGLSAELVR